MTLPPEMEALVEEVAQALCKAEGFDWNAQASFLTSASGSDEEQDGYRSRARAIIPLIYTAGHRAGIEEAASLMERTVSKSAATAIRSISEQEKSRG